MGDGTADEGDLTHSGDAEIADILPFATQEPVVLLAQNRGADPEFRHLAPSENIGLFDGSKEQSG
jgi:hypothetical protein